MKKTVRQKVREHVPFFSTGVWKVVATSLLITAFMGGMQIAAGWQTQSVDVGGLLESAKDEVSSVGNEQKPLLGSSPEAVDDVVSQALVTAVTALASDKKSLETQAPILFVQARSSAEPVVAVSAQPPRGDFQRANRAFKKNQETLSRLFKE